jgi:hypothetical protein
LFVFQNQTIRLCIDGCVSSAPPLPSISGNDGKLTCRWFHSDTIRYPIDPHRRSFVHQRNVCVSRNRK